VDLGGKTQSSLVRALDAACAVFVTSQVNVA
jgi:hypothetical protein